MSQDLGLSSSFVLEEKKPRDDDEPLGSLSSPTTEEKNVKKKTKYDNKSGSQLIVIVCN